MNEKSPSLHEPSDAPSLGGSQPPKRIIAKVPLEADLYREISNALDELSRQSDFKLTIAKFLRRTIVEHWRVQLERYRKSQPSFKKFHG